MPEVRRRDARARRRTCSTPGSRRGCGRSRRSAGRRRRRTSQRFYPNDVMMTGFDIIFFWVARMMMMGLHFMGDVPFRTVFIHGLVRDEHGEKMSKTQGNVVDPLDVIEKHGTDALRFTLAALAAPGTDPSLAEARLLGYKAFVNKLWNAARFVLMNLEGEIAPSYDPVGAAAAEPLDPRRAPGRRRTTVNAALAEYRFDEAANALYHFVWDELLRLVPRDLEGVPRRRGDGARRAARAARGARDGAAAAAPVHAVRDRGDLAAPAARRAPSIMLAPFPQRRARRDATRAEAHMSELMAAGDRDPHHPRRVRVEPQAARWTSHRGRRGERRRGAAEAPGWIRTLARARGARRAGRRLRRPRADDPAAGGRAARSTSRWPASSTSRPSGRASSTRAGEDRGRARGLAQAAGEPAVRRPRQARGGGGGARRSWPS